MSLRKIARHIPWRQCIRRPIHMSCARQQYVHDNASSTDLETFQAAKAENLVKAMTDKPIAQRPSSLSSLPSEEIATPMIPTTWKPNIRHTRSTPVPMSYDSRAYSEAKRAAQDKTDPTPEQLDDLFKLMEFDSKLGELRLEAQTIWKEMRSRGILPTTRGYIALLKLAEKIGDTIMQDEIIESLSEDNIPLTSDMLHPLLKGMAANHEYERAIFLFRDIRARGVRPLRKTYIHMIYMCIELNEAEEAFRILIDSMENKPVLADTFWWMVLECSARNGYLEGTLHCWQHIQNIPNASIPEGLCLDVLSMAAQHGQPALATSVFGALSDLGIQFSSHHFLPLIEAYTRCGDLRQAFIVLNIMRESSNSPPQLTHLNFLIEAIGQSSQTLDRAFFIFQDIVQKEGKSIDITAFNALLSACLNLNDASRAISTYRDAASLKVVPNLETYNILLYAASKVGHRELAMYILSDLKAAQITPNQDTYSRVILTCLFQPEGSYDQAFLYLEEMKASGYIPSSGLYSAFVKKCVYHNDERAVTLLDEMKKLGYDIKLLETYVADAARLGVRSKLLDRKASQPKEDVVQDDAVKRFLQWKG